MPGEPPSSPTYDLDALVARMRAVGARITLRRDPAPPALEAVVYRIVQEGLTNAMRHATGASIDVRVETTAILVRVRVSDDGPGADGSESGFGLTGLRERVALSGGRLLIGRGPGGGFVLDAELPVREEARL
jgi:signal transduction histidine kinase